MPVSLLKEGYYYLEIIKKIKAEGYFLLIIENIYFQLIQMENHQVVLEITEKLKSALHLFLLLCTIMR